MAEKEGHQSDTETRWDPCSPYSIEFPINCAFINENKGSFHSPPHRAIGHKRTVTTGNQLMRREQHSLRDNFLSIQSMTSVNGFDSEGTLATTRSEKSSRAFNHHTNSVFERLAEPSKDKKYDFQVAWGLTGLFLRVNPSKKSSKHNRTHGSYNDDSVSNVKGYVSANFNTLGQKPKAATVQNFFSQG